MGQGVYLRPLGLIHDAACAKDAVAGGAAGPLGGGAIAFTHCQVIEGGARDARRSMQGFADLSGSKEAAIADVLARITAPRPAIAGLTFDRPRVMGIVNVTPDSFSDGGLYDRTEGAVTHAARMIDAGADIVDVGGESTRPGAGAVAADEEAERVIPVIAGLRGVDAAISVDTRKPSVMRAAADAGAQIVNDVSALTYASESVQVVAGTGLPIVLMHAQGDPKTMQDDPHYEDVCLEIFDFLHARIAACEAAGIMAENIIADPGIGFGKTLAHNLELLAGLTLFHGLGVPLAVGASRKRFIGTLSDAADPRDRLSGSLAAAIVAVQAGVQIVRVHDVSETRKALDVWSAAGSGVAR